MLSVFLEDAPVKSSKTSSPGYTLPVPRYCRNRHRRDFDNLISSEASPETTFIRGSSPFTSPSEAILKNHHPDTARLEPKTLPQAPFPPNKSLAESSHNQDTPSIKKKRTPVTLKFDVHGQDERMDTASPLYTRLSGRDQEMEWSYSPVKTPKI